MKQNDLLGLEVRLLLARHGRNQVLRAIAEVENVDVASLEQDIVKRYVEREQKKKRPKVTTDDLLRETKVAPDVRDALESLVRRYDAREFLPQLRDVKRFLESRGFPIRSSKSRQDALPQLIKALAQCSIHDLRGLVDDTSARKGDLSILAEQILRNRRTLPGQ